MNRLWVFQSDRPFTKEETEHISTTIKHFLSQWNAHGAALEAGFTIRHNQFIIINVNETNTQTSGCAIDEMTRMIQKLEKEFNLSLLNKMNIAYKENGEIKILPLKRFKEVVSEGHLSLETIIFNNAVSSLEELNAHWEIPLKESWAKTLVK